MTTEEKTELLAEYHRRKSAGKLPANLHSPVPSRIRDECLKQYKAGIRPDGSAVLEGYFKRNHKGDFHSGVLDMDRDRFKSTADLLRGRDFEPEEKNYELLAWLLGPERLPVSGPIIFPTNERSTFKNLRLRLKNNKSAFLMATIALCVITGAGIIIKNMRSCMLWNGKEYQVVSCNVPSPGNTIYASDQRKIEKFKKVMRLDTVTEASIGKLWYFKINKHLELFTDSGMHPLWRNRRLKPLTHYMLLKYLTQDTTTIKSVTTAVVTAD
ncbi:hypothetical protein FPZ42_07125 [Mucilaginibacter achroorhodeus]|uniref:Uncharacterized protein n=1 Tax=Mucilaginibacter achroorhodeus TaxID=2599294 RepID=A0A563U651_9SPHI|nr:hypothetical protein [Mucilaginibacter achroorhodeus]TWR26803.1 hypothetical protein FPZ42_07125 [Mucilaginibacter achroorhodeus]